MTVRTNLVLTAPQHAALKRHLFPGDGKEAATVLVCSRVVADDSIKLMVQQYILVPYDACEREPNFLTWSGDYLEEALDRAEEDDLSIVLLHSHPGGLFEFSMADDRSDGVVMPTLFAGRPKRHHGPLWHGSAIMVGDGRIRARLYDSSSRVSEIDVVAVYGDDLYYFWNPDRFRLFCLPRPMAFSEAMRAELGQLSACVVGVSGTGSIVAEQLARLGFGNIILVDFDRIELKNLNRILNSSLADAEAKRLKVEVIAKAIQRFRSDARVIPVPTGIERVEAIRTAAGADVLFSCVDSDEGRQICDLMSSAFLQPLFDVGVTIPVHTTETGPSILDVAGRVDYVWPGGSTLADRQVFTPASLAAEYLARADAASHKARVKEGYMPGSLEEAPSVIALNMRAASACVMEFIARAYPFRHDPNDQRARTVFSLAACEEEYEREDTFVRATNHGLARGIKRPLLGLPMLED